MTFDPNRNYVHHIDEVKGRIFEQDGKFYTTQGQPIDADGNELVEPVEAAEEVPAADGIPAGMKKGKFGRLVPA